MVQTKLALMRALLLFSIILVPLKPAESVNGVIWDKKSGTFVPIFSIPSFAAWNQEVLRKSREQETHNFQGKTVRFSYYEITNLLNTEENGTRVSGAIGELWNILADHLNFTLKPMMNDEMTVGANVSGPIYNGLLRVLQLNETDVIPRVEAYRSRLRVLRYTVPFYKTNSRLYIRREVKYESYWMLKLFAVDLWHAILWMYFIISACSYVTQTTEIVLTRQKTLTSINDHLLYNFGMIYCEQSYLPDSFSLSSCMVELCLGVFTLLLRTAFGALVFEYLSRVTTQPPFDDIASLLDDTAYKIVILLGSLQHLLVKRKAEPIYTRVNKLNRYVYVQTMQELYDTVCLPETYYTIFQSEDMKKASGLFVCRLNPVGGPLVESIITSGVALDFEYRRTIDITIIKLHESGIINLMRERWIESKNVEAEDEGGAEAINMEEVYLILCVLGIGWLIASVIFVFEKLTFRYYNKRKPTRIPKPENKRRDHRATLKNVIKPSRKRVKGIGEHGTPRSGTLRGWCHKTGLIKSDWSAKSDYSKRKMFLT